MNAKNIISGTEIETATREQLREALRKNGVEYAQTNSLSLEELRRLAKIEAALAMPPALAMATPTIAAGSRAAELMAELAAELEREQRANGGAALEALEVKLGEVERMATAARELVEDASETAANAAASVEAIADKLATIEAAISASPKAAARAARAIASGGASGGGMLKEIERFYPSGADNGGIIICLSSAPGGGKTTAVNELALAYDEFVSHGCSNDIDEIGNLLGGATPDGRGGFIVTDGPLTQAFRAAAGGKTTLLFLDEIFRLQEAAQKFLLTILEPSKKSGKFTLRTRRADATGAFEILEASTEFLHIVCAGNLGTIEPEEAFWRRFEHKRIAFSASECAELAEKVCAKYGHALSVGRASAFAALVQATRAACKAGALRYPITNATLARAACVAADVGEIGAIIANGIPANCCSWDSELGETTDHSAATAFSIAENFLKAWNV